MIDGSISYERGVMALEPIKYGQIVTFYEGDLLLRKWSYSARKGVMRDEKLDSFFETQYNDLMLEKSYVFTAPIDGQNAVEFNAIPTKYRDTLGRNINHSDKKPNLEPMLVACKSALKAFVEDPYGKDYSPYIRIGMKCIRKVEPGDFLRYNYNDKNLYFASKN